MYLVRFCSERRFTCEYIIQYMGYWGFGWLCIRCQYDCSARPDPDLLEVTHQTYNLSLFYIQQLYQMISFLSLSGI